MRAPSDLTSGTYSLQVALSTNDYEGNHFELPETIAIEVAGVGRGRPQLIIEEAQSHPPVLGPGDAFSLTLQLINRGTRTATGVLVGVTSAELAVPAARGNAAAIDRISIGQSRTVTLPLILGEITQAGHQGLGISLDYSDYDGGTYADQQNVGLEVVTALSDRPQLIVDSYATTRDSLGPGDAFTLTLQVSNVGGGPAERLLLTLGGEGGSDLGPFAPLRSSNVEFVPRVAPGERVAVEQQLVVDGSTESGSYSLPVALAYDDARGTRHTDSQLISLLVRRQPHVDIGFYRPVMTTTVGVPVALPVEVTNIGRSLINISTMELTSEQLDIQDGSLYIGPLDGGTSASLEATAVAMEDGRAEVLVSVHYLDDFDQPQVLTETLTVDVEEPIAPTPTPEGGPQEQRGGLLGRVWRFLRALLGLGS